MDRPIPMAEWGRDHWTTFHYIAIRCSSSDGAPDRDKMRTDAERHPHLLGRHARAFSAAFADKKYPTRLRGGVHRDDHDDWDCVDDMIAAGLLTATGTGMHPCYSLTDRGWTVFRQIAEYRSDRGASVLDDWQPRGDA